MRAKMERRSKARLALGVLAPALLCGLASCGGNSGGDYAPAQSLQRPAPRHDERTGNRHYAFWTEARPPIRAATVGGRRLRGGGRWLIVVRVRLQNRLDTPLRLGLLTATVRTEGGRAYRPILADSRETSAPLFARSTVRPRGVLTADLVYRLPRRDIDGSKLAVRDPARRRSFELRLF